MDEKDDGGDQPIHYSAKSDCAAGVELLVQAGAVKCGKGTRKQHL